jgi:phosphate transport system permease protein
VQDITRKVRRKEKVAKGMLWLASIFTIGILIAIVGFILFRGFISDRREEFDVIVRGNEVTLMGDKEIPVAVIVNRKVKIDDLTVAELKELFTGARSNWGFLSEQDISVRVFALRRGTDAGDAFVQSVMGVEAYADDIQFFDGDRKLFEKVASLQGAIGFISGDGLKELDAKEVRVVSLRSIAVVVNPEVLELRDNRKLRYLTEGQLKAIFSGRVTNWQSVGGIDLPVLPVHFSQDNTLNENFKTLVLGEDADFAGSSIVVDSSSELFDILSSTPGAVGFCRFTDALDFEQQIVKIEKRTVKQNINLRFLVEPPKRAGVVGGVSTVILNTMFMIILTLLFSTPIGIMAAVYLTEYAKQGILIKILRFGTETLAGIPSIIFGLFGFLFFVTLLKMGIGLISGTLTITMMILPTIVRTSEEAIKAVPLSYREGSLALGATQWQTIVRAVLPPATPGILTGVILAIGRAIGETAALLFTMGTDYRLVQDLTSSARTLSVHLYILVKEGISFERAFATGTILIAVILIVNFTTNKLVGRMTRMATAKG